MSPELRAATECDRVDRLVEGRELLGRARLGAPFTTHLLSLTDTAPPHYSKETPLLEVAPTAFVQRTRLTKQ